MPGSCGESRRLAFECLESRNLLTNNSGPALYLDGVDNYATAFDAPALDIGTGFFDDFTIEASFYVEFELAGVRSSSLIGKGGAYEILCVIDATGVDTLTLRINGGPTFSTQLNIGTGWHHVAATFDNEFTSSIDRIEMFFDGSQIFSFFPFDIFGIQNTSSPVNIGSPAYYGFIDEVRLSNAVRYNSATYTVPTTPFAADGNTRALWHFDESPGSSSFSDSSGNGNTQFGVNGAQSAYPPGVFPYDYGDAPDLFGGSGPGNYQTVFFDNGPRHTIVTGIRMGATIDGEDGTLQNAAANADDVNAALPDDEDGVINPSADLALTVGTQPRVNVRVTNTLGFNAFLVGWIDYNGDGNFTANEQSLDIVPSGSINAIRTLVFPAVPNGFSGKTYARFRLSTDGIVANPIFPAANGEVEDYVVTITAPSTGTVDPNKTVTIADNTNGGPSLADYDRFGNAVAALGDLDGDGVKDLVVGAHGDDTGGDSRGAVYVLLMNANGSVKTRQKIGSGVGGGPTLADVDRFGISVASLGDLDGDGITDIAVGADLDDTGGAGSDRGAVYVVFLNADGTAKGSQKIASGVGGGPTLAFADVFGSSVTSMGDLDGDGVTDLAVGAIGDDTGGTYRGAVHVLFLNANGTVKSSQKIASGVGGGPTLVDSGFFGNSAASLGDVDGDGVTDLAVGASGDSSEGANRGALYVLLMNANGTVKSSQRIASDTSGGPALNDGDRFGRSVASLGDLDGDGVSDVVVGAHGDDTGGNNRGALHVLLLKSDGTVKSSQKIASGVGGGPSLTDHSSFGSSVTSLGDFDGDGLVDLAVGVEGDDGGGIDRGAVQLLFLKRPADYGDAPDSGSGTGTGNYNTVADDDGPSHVIVPGIRLGSKIDGDSGTLQNTAANADDVNAALPDDEDGLTNPAADLVLTVGGQPTVDLRVTNATGAAATLYGWIDYNADGLFDNGTERASVAVPNGTSNGIVTVIFPAVPSGFTGTSYARFRLSTDGAAADSTGAAADGEVEDYRLTIVAPSSGTADTAKTVKIADGISGGPVLANGDYFGSSLVSLGDLDGDGVTDVVAGADGDETGGSGRGAVHVLFMNTNGTVKNIQEIASGIGGGPTLADFDGFGRSIAPLGDLDGDGVTDIAVGANGDNTGGSGRGAVYVLFLNANGTVKSSQKIASGIGGGPTLADVDGFGRSVAPLGDLNGDGVPDLAIGAAGDDTGGENRGSVHILYMNSSGTANGSAKIASGTTGAPSLADSDIFGVSVASLGDLDGDGIADLAVGADGDGIGGSSRGAVHILFLNAIGTVKGSQKIASGTIGGPTLADGDHFGRSLSSLGDLDGDGVLDVAVGAVGDDTGGSFSGAVYIVLLNADGTPKNTQKIADNTGGGPALADNDSFGTSLASLGDLDGDGLTDLVVGADGDDVVGPERGAVYVLYLEPVVSALPGDFDLDGDVDGRDFLAWQRGESPTPLSSGDLQLWQEEYGESELLAVSSQLLARDDVRPEQAVRALLINAGGNEHAFIGGTRVQPRELVKLVPAYNSEPVFKDSYVEQVDRAFDDLGIVPRGTIRGFGDIAVRRAPSPRLADLSWESICEWGANRRGEPPQRQV